MKNCFDGNKRDQSIAFLSKVVKLLENNSNDLNHP